MAQDSSGSAGGASSKQWASPFEKVGCNTAATARVGKEAESIIVMGCHCVNVEKSSDCVYHATQTPQHCGTERPLTTLRDG
jgi:hypothetical protein